MPAYTAFGSEQTQPFANANALFGVSNTPPCGSGGLYSASSNPCFGASNQPLSSACGTPTPSFGSSFPFGSSSPSLFQSSPRPTPSTFATLPLGNTSAPFGVPSASPFGSGGLSSASSNTCPGTSSQPLCCRLGTPSMSFGPSSAFDNLNSSSFQSSLRMCPSTFGAPTCPFGTRPTVTTFGSAATLPHGNTAPCGVSNAPPSGSGGLFGASTNPCSRASNDPLSCALGTPSLSFGPSSTFGKSSCGLFESSPRPTPFTFGTPTCPFGTTPSFLWPSSNSTFGSVTTPALVGTSHPFGGVSRAPLCGSQNTPAFGPAVTSLLGNPGTPFGGSSAISKPSSDVLGIPSPGVGCIPAFEQSGPSLGQSANRTTPSLFSSPLLSPPSYSTETLSNAGPGQSGCNGLYWGSKLGAYTPTVEYEGGDSTLASKMLVSISAMPVYTRKSHEELRWEDYQMRGYRAAYLSGERVPFSSGNQVPSIDFCSRPTACIKGTSGGQHKGSRVSVYTCTDDSDGYKLKSISGMGAYRHRSHEELRWEDYQLGDKGTTASFVSTHPTRVFQSTTPSHPTSTPVPFQINVFSIPSTGVGGNTSPSISIPAQPSQTSSTSSSGGLALTQAGVVNIFAHTVNIQPVPQKEMPGTSSSANLFHAAAGTVNIFTSNQLETLCQENPARSGSYQQTGNAATEQEANGVHVNEGYKKADSPVKKSVGDVSIDVQMPKLSLTDYYTKPHLLDLALKERAEPGYCRHVKDFVVGRHDYGCIKLIGETDIVGLDLESLVCFKERELVIYKNDSKKSLPVPGSNRAVEVTLQNIRCFDKKRGQLYTEGPKVEMYKELLMKKAKELGGEFLSYDPFKGEWKFTIKLSVMLPRFAY